MWLLSAPELKPLGSLTKIYRLVCDTSFLTLIAATTLELPSVLSVGTLNIDS